MSHFGLLNDKHYLGWVAASANLLDLALIFILIVLDSEIEESHIAGLIFMPGQAIFNFVARPKEQITWIEDVIAPREVLLHSHKYTIDLQEVVQESAVVNLHLKVFIGERSLHFRFLTSIIEWILFIFKVIHFGLKIVN